MRLTCVVMSIRILSSLSFVSCDVNVKYIPNSDEFTSEQGLGLTTSLHIIFDYHLHLPYEASHTHIHYRGPLDNHCSQSSWMASDREALKIETKLQEKLLISSNKWQHLADLPLVSMYRTPKRKD